jgi:flagellar protein FliO/FliZ
MTLSVRQKLFCAAGLALTAPLVAAMQGASASNVARVVLGLAAVAGIALWFIKARGGLQLGSKFKSAPRLNVVQRVGLSQRTGLALVEVDGKPYLVVHGDGFARIRPARRAQRVTSHPSPALEGVAS